MPKKGGKAKDAKKAAKKAAKQQALQAEKARCAPAQQLCLLLRFRSLYPWLLR